MEEDGDLDETVEAGDGGKRSSGLDADTFCLPLTHLDLLSMCVHPAFCREITP